MGLYIPTARFLKAFKDASTRRQKIINTWHNQWDDGDIEIASEAAPMEGEDCPADAVGCGLGCTPECDGPGDLLTHSVYGAGVVLSAVGDDFTVQFATGQQVIAVDDTETLSSALSASEVASIRKMREPWASNWLRATEQHETEALKHEQSMNINYQQLGAVRGTIRELNAKWDLLQGEWEKGLQTLKGADFADVVMRIVPCDSMMRFQGDQKVPGDDCPT